MKLELAVLADYASQTADGKLNVMGIFQGFGAASFPTAMPLMNVVLILEMTKSEIGHTQQLAVKLVDEDGNPLFQIGGEMKVELTTAQIPHGAPPPRQNQIIRLQNIPIPGPGIYAVDILINNQHAKTLSLYVSQVMATPQPQG